MRIFSKSSFEKVPEVFNWIEICRLCKPLHNKKSKLFKTFFGLLACMLGIIVLLKNDIFLSLVIIFKTLLKFFFQNLNIKVSIHLPFNSGCKSWPFPQHTTPHHQRTSFKL